MFLKCRRFAKGTLMGLIQHRQWRHASFNSHQQTRNLGSGYLGATFDSPAQVTKKLLTAGSTGSDFQHKSWAHVSRPWGHLVLLLQPWAKLPTHYYSKILNIL